MALTISNHPSKSVTNEPTVDVTTSLTEGASVQNVRIRAEVYVAGNTSKVATLEQTKGLDNWDFKKLLNNFIGRCDTALGGSVNMITPDVGSELLTGWFDAIGSDTFSSSGREITALTSSSEGGAISNDLGAQSIGDLLIIGIEDSYVNSGATEATFGLTTSPVVADTWPFITKAANKIFFFTPVDDTYNSASYLTIGETGIDVELKATIHKITDLKNNPGVYFRVKFTEVAEDASGVISTGATAVTDTLLYIPAIMPTGEDFETDYLLSGTSSKFLNKGVRNGMKFIAGIGSEIRLLFATDETNLRSYNSYGSYNTATGCGWGIIIGNDNTLPSAGSANVRVTANRGSIITISESLNIQSDNKCYEDKEVLTFLGDLGEEIFNFTGGTDKGYAVEREVMKNEYGIRKPLSAYRKTEMDLYTGWIADDLLPLFLELLSTIQQVYMIDTDQDENIIEVSITDQSMKVKQRDQLRQHKIGIEYHE